MNSEASSNSCCLDQHIVSKGSSAATVVFGGVDSGVQYGILAADYILCKLLSSIRYNRVICICMDRRPESVISIAEMYFEQLQVIPIDEASSCACVMICIDSYTESQKILLLF